MKNIKEIFAVLLCACVILSLAACGSSTDVIDETTTAPPETEGTTITDDQINSRLGDMLGIDKSTSFILSKKNLAQRGYAEYEGQCEGIYISNFLDTSPMLDEDCVIRRGDVIREINGRRVPSYLAAYNALEAVKPGDEITLTIFRLNLVTKESAAFRAKVVIPGGETSSAEETA